MEATFETNVILTQGVIPYERDLLDFTASMEKSGLWKELNAKFRERVRKHADKTLRPTAGILDSQSVKTARSENTIDKNLP